VVDRGFEPLSSPAKDFWAKYTALKERAKTRNRDNMS
jgi:hypothetical protein